MKKVYEDAPVNNVGGGGIAGVGVGPAGEPGVSVKAQKKRYGQTKSIPTPVIINMMRRKAPNPIAEEQIDEVSKKTLSSYIKKASDSRASNQGDAEFYQKKEIGRAHV